MKPEKINDKPLDQPLSRRTQFILLATFSPNLYMQLPKKPSVLAIALSEIGEALHSKKPPPEA